MQEFNQYAVFDLGSETYALPGFYVEKIDYVHKNKVRSVPNTYPYVKGIITFKDDVVPLISLADRFNVTSSVDFNDSFLIICNLKEKDLLAAFVVDAVYVKEFPSDFTVSNVNEVIVGEATKFIEGIYKETSAEINEKTNEKEEKLIILLDIEKLFTPDFALENIINDFKNN